MIAAETIACAFIARELWYMLFPSFIIVLQSYYYFSFYAILTLIIYIN